MKFKRADRIASLLKEEISQLFITELRDPKLGFVTITKVRVSDDLRNAKVYYSVMGNEKIRNEAQETIKKASKYIKGEIGHRVNLRYVPEISFFYDDSLDYADRIQNIINRLNSPQAGKENQEQIGESN